MKPWIAVAIFVSLIIGVVGWFFVISPTMADTADTRASIEEQENRTIILQQQLALLEQQYADIETYRAELEAITAQVPASLNASEYRRTITARAAAAGITVEALTLGVPAQADGASVQAAAGAAEDTTTEGEAGSEGTDAAASGGGNASVAVTGNGTNVYGVPLQITVIGTYSSAMAFLDSLQDPTGRLYVVGGVAMVQQRESEASAGRPALKTGDVELAIDGYLLVLPNTEAGAVEQPAEGDGTDGETGDGTEGGEPGFVLPQTQQNPFAPLND